MKAITVEPKKLGSARLEEVSEPDARNGSVLVEAAALGSVNANKRRWYRAGVELARADRKWLAGLIARREKPENFMQALERQPDDIKVVIQFSGV